MGRRVLRVCFIIVESRKWNAGRCNWLLKKIRDKLLDLLLCTFFSAAFTIDLDISFGFLVPK